jgi:hypothetical protein
VIDPARILSMIATAVRPGGSRDILLAAVEATHGPRSAEEVHLALVESAGRQLRAPVSQWPDDDDQMPYAGPMLDRGAALQEQALTRVAEDRG